MEIKKWLAQFPSSEELANLYKRWRKKYPPLKSFPIPQELVEFLHARKSENFKMHDEILYDLIKQCKSIKDSSILIMYLFILLFPFLEIPFFYWKKRMLAFHIQDDELWNEIWCGFHETLAEINLEKSNKRIGLYFQGKVRNYIEKFYKKLVHHSLAKVSFNDEIETPLFDVSTSGQFIEENWYLEYMVDKLVEEKTIDIIDKHLIIDHILQRISIGKIAVEINVPFQTLKKRLYRLKIKLAKRLRNIFL